jgi:hypothetical protein
VLVFDVVEQVGDVAAPDLGEHTVAPVREHVAVEDAPHLVGGAHALLLDVPREPRRGHIGDGVSLHRRRLERRESFLESLDDRARLLATLLDRLLDRAADAHPTLLAERVARDDVEHGRTLRHDADAMAGHLRVGLEVAPCPALELGDLRVVPLLAAGAALLGLRG